MIIYETKLMTYQDETLTQFVGQEEPTPEEEPTTEEVVDQVEGDEAPAEETTEAPAEETTEAPAEEGGEEAPAEATEDTPSEE